MAQRKHGLDGTQITLLPDVSRRTLQMRRCMKPLLEKLGDQKITYKWGHSFHLIARKGGRSYTLRHPAEVPAFLSSLELPPVSLPNWLAFALPSSNNNPTANPSGRPQRSMCNRFGYFVIEKFTIPTWTASSGELFPRIGGSTPEVPYLIPH